MENINNKKENDGDFVLPELVVDCVEVEAVCPLQSHVNLVFSRFLFFTSPP